MPYVEGFGTWPFGEEWLWEAVACVYLPLLDVLDGRSVTLGLTPVLCDQLDAMRGEAGDRYVRFLRDVRAPIHDEDAGGLDAAGEPELAAEVRRAAGTTRGRTGTSRSAADLVSAFGALRGVELWTSAATHGLLPLMATDAGLRLQVATGIASHTHRFGDWGGGFWLPECAYVPGLERAGGSTASARSAWTRRASRASTTSRRSPRRPDRSRSRWTGDGSARLERRERLPGPRPIATTGAAPSTTSAVEQRGPALRP